MPVRLKRDEGFCDWPTPAKPWPAKPANSGNARLLFREAFLHNPREIEIDRLRSHLIRHLVSEVRKAGFSGEEVACWVPVHAAFEHSFSVKRELEEHEVNTLQEQSSRLEADLAKNGSNARILLPLLLNRYIWLLDHYTLQVNDAVTLSLSENVLSNTTKPGPGSTPGRKHIKPTHSRSEHDQTRSGAGLHT